MALLFFIIGGVVAFPIGYLIGVRKSSQIQVGGDNSVQRQVR